MNPHKEVELHRRLKENDSITVTAVDENNDSKDYTFTGCFDEVKSNIEELEIEHTVYF